jgi:uncharacterized protein (DUF4415 family)
MSSTKPRSPELSDEEEARIQAGIAKDLDNPEWTEADFAAAVTGREFFTTDQLAGIAKRRRGRPKSETPKRQVTLRLDGDVIDSLRASGPGWQVRVNQVLRDWLRIQARD